jgi:hypothetical protein
LSHMKRSTHRPLRTAHKVLHASSVRNNHRTCISGGVTTPAAQAVELGRGSGGVRGDDEEEAEPVRGVDEAEAVESCGEAPSARTGEDGGVRPTATR